MDIRWHVSVAASCPYAAGEILRGRPLVDEVLAERLEESTALFCSDCVAYGVDPIALLDHLTAVSVETCSLDGQARLAIRKVGGEQRVAPMLPAISGWMRQIQSLYLEIHPRSLEDLELRSTPLREQWEARGPGLISTLKRIVGADLIVENADVFLVQPVLGGGGIAHIPYNRVSFEAVLANPVAELPEVLRLAWLISQLHLDLPSIQGSLSRPRTLEVGALAMVPPVLAAGHDVELCGPPESLLPMACAAWRLPSVDQDALLAWWETYCVDRPPWSTALAALDRLLAAETA